MFHEHTRFSDSKANTLFAAEDLGANALYKLLLSKLEKGRGTNAETTDEVPYETTAAGARELIGKKHLVEQIPLFGSNALHARVRQMCGEMHAEQTREITAVAHLLVYFLRHHLRLIPFGHVGLDHLIYPLSDFVAERCMGLVEVGRMILRKSVSDIASSFWEHNLPTGTMKDQRMG